MDVGGSHVKLALAHDERRSRFDSSPTLRAAPTMERILHETDGWPYEVVSLGYPGRVGPNGPMDEPANLGGGWVGFDFERAFGRPVRVVNDAVLQALGAYRDGRMLFLGLGTGLGSVLITERVAVPLELGDLPYGNDARLWQVLGRDGLERIGEEKWREAVLRVTPLLKDAFLADYVVLGGGNASRISTTPPDIVCGGNDDAIEGGYRLWREMVEPHDREPSSFWRVVL